MRIRSILLFPLLAALLLAPSGSLARGERDRDKEAEERADTLIAAGEVVVYARSLKQGQPWGEMPVTASLFGRQQAERLQIGALKEVSARVPNFHAPEYGSRMTSSIYVRGLGARIDQPVLGFTVDGVPLLNKDAYDFELMDIQRIEVLRGPQSTLYGRNTMGGVMNLHTLSPLHYEGVRAGIEYSSGNTFKSRASSYFRLRPGLGISVAGSYSTSDGLFSNDFDGSRCDWEEAVGGRVKVEWENGRWEAGNTLSFTSLDQEGFPYASLESGRIAHNDPCAYERNALLDGLTLRYRGGRVLLESVTSYQFLDDRMTLDQDFRPVDYFTLIQDRREHAVTEDVVLRSRGGGRYEWLVGAFGFWRHSDMSAPVTFKRQGLDELIVANVLEQTGYAPEFYKDEFPLDEFPLESDFTNPSWGAALYHESNLRLGRWRLTLGLRVEREWMRLNYTSSTRYACRIVKKDIPPFAISGRLRNAYTELLPAFSALYRTVHGNLYISVKKGYKAGGFNTQMFSDVLQNELMERMGASAALNYDVSRVVSYKPEQSWNYELGGHHRLAKGDLQIDWALFFIDCRDQQLTVFPEGQQTGRMMTNAGRTHSWGGEFAIAARPLQGLNLSAAYGYTHAVFRRYLSGDTDYAGKRVPYAPEHTLSARADYEIAVGRRWLERIVPSAELRGVGPIFWNEENTRRQPFYSLLDCSLRFEQRNAALTLWVRNLAGTRYDTFYFCSVDHEFVQRGRPRTFGASLTLNF